MVATTSAARGRSGTIGPPLLIVLLGFLSIAVSALLLVGNGSTAVHLAGYATGAILPVLLVGIARRVDLDRRRSPHYRAVGLFATLLIVLVIGAIVTAALHIWPLATAWAS